MRGRGGDDPAAALRDLLVDTAERLLAERQVAALTTREIARAAGVSDGVLYNYFSDKNELIVTAMVRRYGRMVARFDAELPAPGSGTVEDNLLIFERRVLELHMTGLPIVAGLLPTPDLLQRFVEGVHSQPEGPQLFAHRIIEYLQGEQELGRLPAGDLEAPTTMLAGSAMILALTSLMGMHPGDPAEQLPGVVRTLLYGLTHQG